MPRDFLFLRLLQEKFRLNMTFLIKDMDGLLGNEYLNNTKYKGLAVAGSASNMYYD